MRTQREIADERRLDKLAVVREQIKAGSLRVRKMTAKERAANPPRPRPERGRGSRRKFA